MGEGAVEGSIWAACQRDQPLASPFEALNTNMRRIARVWVEPRTRGNVHQVQISGGVPSQEHDGRAACVRLAARGHRRRILKIEGDLHADDRLHALLGELVGKLQGAEK